MLNIPVKGWAGLTGFGLALGDSEEGVGKWGRVLDWVSSISRGSLVTWYLKF